MWPSSALGRIALAWLSVLLPAFGLTALAVLLSVATRSSIAGVGLPVVIALAMQLYSMVDGPDMTRRLLITSSFDAWHGLLAWPGFYRPLLRGLAVSTLYVIACLAAAHHMLCARDIA